MLNLPSSIAGVRIPDSELAVSAARYARELSTEVVFNHVVRSFVFGGLIAEREGMQYDAELFFTASVLHDLGLTGVFPGPERFEVAGADAADAFLKEKGVPEQRREIVWDAIALHTSIGIASRKRPEIALVHLGAGVDVIGLSLDTIPKGVLDATLESLPRANFKQDFKLALLQTVDRNPQGAMLSFLDRPAHAHLASYSCPDFFQMMDGAGFEE